MHGRLARLPLVPPKFWLAQVTNVAPADSSVRYMKLWEMNQAIALLHAYSDRMRAFVWTQSVFRPQWYNCVFGV